MAILGVDDFKSKLVGGGARSNMFKVTCNFPAYAQGDVELSSFMIKGAQFPSSVVAPVPVLFRGRQLQLAGDRTFEPVTLTIINDTGFEVRNAFERWMNGMSEHNNNTGASNPTDYMADIIVEQLNKQGDVTKTYDMRGCFPTNLSTIELSYDNENQIEEFTVELQVQYWESGTTS
jgi:hypothetical protein|tara:strand:+ start:1561 stop:2088 length:528 start_codon:yes stop_codon:yes gene_type:complete